MGSPAKPNGRTAQGTRLELSIRSLASYLEAHQVARLWKWPTDRRLVKIQGELTVVHGEKTGCDFFGYTEGGRVVIIECKMRENTSLGIGGNRDVPANQWLHLRSCSRANGISLIVWQRGDEVAVMDFDMMHALSIGKGRKSVAWKDIPDHHKHDEHEEGLLLAPYIVTPAWEAPSPRDG